MRAVDTNVLVRLLTRDDAKQAAAADSFVAKGAWVSHLVLVETCWVLDTVFNRGPAQIATAIDMLLSHESLTLQEPEVVEAALTLYRKRPTLGFSDSMVLEVARKAGHVPLGTFDRGLGKQEGASRL